MDRTERFYRIELLIRNRGRIGFETLRTELEVSRATLKRDLQYLRERLDAPIVYDRMDNAYRFGTDSRTRSHELPGLWFSGFMVYLGCGWVYFAYVTLKQSVILGAHCAWAWDEPLYRMRALRPLMWLLERTISTPATHRAHHAITNADGIGHYKGNFGNLLFFWDVLFGTAHITRRYPAEVGLRDDQLFGAERWDKQMFYPLLQSQREYSALKFGGRIYSDE